MTVTARPNAEIQPFRIEIGTADSSARLYYEAARSGTGYCQPNKPSAAPTAVAVIPHDVSIPRFAESANNIVHSEFDRGVRFAALESPDLLIDDVRQFFIGSGGLKLVDILDDLDGE